MEEVIRTLDKHEQIIDSLVENHKELLKFNSKLNGEYLKMDKEAAVYRSSVTQDLDFIKENIKQIMITLKTVIDGYVKREEFEVRFRRLQDEVDSRLAGVHERIDKKSDSDVITQNLETIKEDISSLVDNQKWVTRTVIGMFIMAIGSLVFILR